MFQESIDTMLTLFLGHLLQVSNLEAAIGASAPLATGKDVEVKKKNGIDVVLGAQWGDEGKGKLVDLLSQVRTCRSHTHTRMLFVVLVTTNCS